MATHIDRRAVLAAAGALALGSVTALALLVAGYELLQILGWKPPVTDLQVSFALCAALAIVFAYVFVKTRKVETAKPPVAATIIREVP